jgi:hypothetical protein
MTMLRQIAFAAAISTAWLVAQAADAGSGRAMGVQSGPTSAAPLREADASLANEVPTVAVNHAVPQRGRNAERAASA